MLGAAAQKPSDAVPAWALEEAAALASSSGRRKDIPIRRQFVRTEDPTITPPSARLASSGGRGGGVPLRLYVALIWRCSANPFETEVTARRWARLLGLPSPDTLGARRITKALDQLESEGLVSLVRRRGESTIITLQHESGSGRGYSLPSTAYVKARTPEQRERHLYFKVPSLLWTEGKFQCMSGAATAMLLILLSEQAQDGSPTWWSTERFPQLFGLTTATRSKGTKELVEAGLLRVQKSRVSDGSPSASFGRERVRNKYILLGEARPASVIAADQRKNEASRKLISTAGLPRTAAAKSGRPGSSSSPKARVTKSAAPSRRAKA